MELEPESLLKFFVYYRLYQKQLMQYGLVRLCDEVIFFSIRIRHTMYQICVFNCGCYLS